jgi:hypothetical protein
MDMFKTVVEPSFTIKDVVKDKKIYNSSPVNLDEECIVTI